MCPSEGAVPPPRCNQSATTRLGSRTAAWRSLELEVAPSCPLNVKRSFGLFFTFGGGGNWCVARGDMGGGGRLAAVLVVDLRTAWSTYIHGVAMDRPPTWNAPTEEERNWCSQ